MLECMHSPHNHYLVCFPLDSCLQCDGSKLRWIRIGNMEIFIRRFFCLLSSVRVDVLPVWGDLHNKSIPHLSTNSQQNLDDSHVVNNSWTRWCVGWSLSWKSSTFTAYIEGPLWHLWKSCELDLFSKYRSAILFYSVALQGSTYPKNLCFCCLQQPCLHPVLVTIVISNTSLGQSVRQISIPYGTFHSIVPTSFCRTGPTVDEAWRDSWLLKATSWRHELHPIITTLHNCFAEVHLNCRYPRLS